MSENKSIEIENERYEGEFLNDMFHGQGTFYFANGDVYVGQWVENKRSGRGIMYFEDGDRYEGEFLNDKFNGKGTYFFKTGVKRAGTWRNDKLVSSQQNSASASASAGFHTNSSGQISPNFFSTGRRAVFVSSPTNESKVYVQSGTNISEINQSVSASGAVINKDNLVRDVLMAGVDSEEKEKCLDDVAEVRAAEAKRIQTAASSSASKASPQTSPRASPRASPKPSPKASPKASPKSSPKTSPRASPTLLDVLTNLSRPSPKASPKTSPRASPGLELTSVEVTYEQYGNVLEETNQSSSQTVHHVDSMSSNHVRQSTTTAGSSVTVSAPTISQFTPAAQEPTLRSVLESNSKIESFSEQINSTSSLSTLLNTGNNSYNYNNNYNSTAASSASVAAATTTVEVTSNRGGRRCSQIIDDDDTNLDGFSTLADKKRCKELTQQRKAEAKTETKSIFSEKPKSPVPVEKPRTPVPSAPVTRTVSDIISVLSKQEPEPVRTITPSGPSNQILKDLLIMAGSGSTSGSVSGTTIKVPSPRVSTYSASGPSVSAYTPAPSASAYTPAPSASAYTPAPSGPVYTPAPLAPVYNPAPLAPAYTPASSVTVTGPSVSVIRIPTPRVSTPPGAITRTTTIQSETSTNQLVSDLLSLASKATTTRMTTSPPAIKFPTAQPSSVLSRSSSVASTRRVKLENGDSYEGSVRSGRFNGRGTYYYSNGDKYVGDFVDNIKSGTGTLVFSDDDVYDGQFRDNKFNGRGTYQYKDGSSYTGDWKDNKKSGSGKLEFADGDRYEGEFKNDKFNGEGTYTTNDGKVTSGNWVDNEYKPRRSVRASAVDELIESLRSSRRSEQSTAKTSRRSTRQEYTPLDKIDEPECICQPCYTNPCCPYETITEHFNMPSYPQVCAPQVSYHQQQPQCQPQCPPPQFQQVQQCPPGCVPEPIRCPPGCEPDPSYRPSKQQQQQQQFFQQRAF